jgi:hypothetical protein
MISGGFGLTKNITFFLLWHLSSIITYFRMREDSNILQPFVNLEKFREIPRFLYLSVKEEDENKVIEQLKRQCSEITSVRK